MEVTTSRDTPHKSISFSEATDQNSTILKRTQKAYRGMIRGKTRILIAWGMSFLLIFFSRQYPTLLGIGICFFGATIRFWASGYLRKDTKPAVGGPYGMTRNPLYLGTYIMALGIAVSIENWIFLGFVTVVFAAIYHYIILDEETKLHQIFGEAYGKYQKVVPRFFPRPLPASRKRRMEVNPESEHLKFSWALAMKNKAFEAYYSFLGLVALVALSAYFWNEIY